MHGDLLIISFILILSSPVFKQHKLEHLKAKNESSSSSAAQVNSPKPQAPVSQNNASETEKPKSKKREEKQIDYIDLGDISDDEVTDITEKKVLEKTIPCPSCDVKFATNMSLKMHINLQHPVKAEASTD